MCFNSIRLNLKCVTCRDTSLHCNNQSTGQSLHKRCSWSCCLLWAPGNGHRRIPCSPSRGHPHGLQAWHHLVKNTHALTLRFALMLLSNLQLVQFPCFSTPWANRYSSVTAWVVVEWSVWAHWGSRSCRGPYPCTADIGSGAKVPSSHSRHRRWQHWAGHSSVQWTYASVDRTR